MRFLGAKVVLTPAAERGVGMVNKAVELAKTHGWFLTRQFENEANPDMHSRTTAREIVDDFKGERLDYWVTGFGTGGTLKGVGRVLAKERPDTKIVVCEPVDAPMLASGQPQERNARRLAGQGPSGLEAASDAGLGPGLHSEAHRRRVDMLKIDRIVPIADADAMRCSKELAQKEGIFVGITAGATFAGALRSLQDRAQGLDRAGHAARHRRALSLDAAVRRRAGRHDRGRAEDHEIDAGQLAAAQGVTTADVTGCGQRPSRSPRPGAGCGVLQQAWTTPGGGVGQGGQNTANFHAIIVAGPGSGRAVRRSAGCRLGGQATRTGLFDRPYGLLSHASMVGSPLAFGPSSPPTRTNRVRTIDH